VAARARARVTLFEAGAEIGGQFNLARRIPGKEEFAETLRYYRRMIEVDGVDLHLNTRVDAPTLAAMASTRWSSHRHRAARPELEGIDHPMVTGYIDVILGRRPWADGWRSWARAASASTSPS
jgi:2,4-dienoyl-CoA reductase (NADPH2)